MPDKQCYGYTIFPDNDHIYSQLVEKIDKNFLSTPSECVFLNLKAAFKIRNIQKE